MRGVNTQKIVMHRIIGMGFVTLAIRFDPAAAALLADRRERLMVASWVYGQPVPPDELPLTDH